MNVILFAGLRILLCLLIIFCAAYWAILGWFITTDETLAPRFFIPIYWIGYALWLFCQMVIFYNLITLSFP